ncbi:transcription-silencing protein clr2 [Diplodia corticola]|uniref:Transcription-silencing protein clr2 n=1 Tax=Diplodia corticola TaxID=236234 RepID=A0A1J9S5N7_9PEZI|nr:transcription-silencing protein clr2 [Diplodia corticola]OJD35831.1 transcription-silencing protein clr2 [Diplodia corticola]
MAPNPLAGAIVVPIEPYSDGDPTHCPNRAEFRLQDPPSIYLEKLAESWMKERGEFHKGVTYTLDRLPHGYTVWGKSRKNQPQHVDKWAYGHPQGKTFDSPNRFFPHFLHLMNNKGNTIGCPCAVCSTGSKAKASTPPASSTKQTSVQAMQKALQKFKGKPRQVDTSELRTDDEGTPDVYRNLIDKLKRNGQIDEPLKEPLSLDWRAERNCLPRMLDGLSKQGQWVPRPGELVLFVRNLTPDATEIRLDDATGTHKVWSVSQQRFGSHPRWEAGIVTQTAAETPHVEDLSNETDKQYQRNYSGFRVEPISDPNSTAKHWSKQHRYLPLTAIRPFCFWSEFLQGVPEREWHPTINHTLTVMSSFSLVEKQQFTVLCGDIVRLMPREQGADVTDILKITSVRLHLMNLDTSSDDDYDQGHPYNSAVHITGKAFTSEPTRAASRIPLTETERSGTPIEGYEEEWYWLHDPEKSLRVPFHRILGRCFEAEAMQLWFPSKSSSYMDEQGPMLSRGVEGMFQARHYSLQKYSKMEKGKTWFWGDSRVEALDLATVNGQDVGKNDKSRDPRTWRKLIKVMESSAGLEDKLSLKTAALAERPLRTSSSGRAMAGAWRAINVPEEGDGGMEAAQESRKRPHSMMERNAGVAMDTEMDEDDEAAADQFVDELAGDVALAPSDEEAAESDGSDVIMADEAPGQSKKQKRLRFGME